MSTDRKPGMAINEEKLRRLVHESLKQARDANYPRKPVALHEKATPAPGQGRDDEEEDEEDVPERT
jgi:hypothetical protein